MLTFKIIRKIGKILRGGAGRKEIMLGTLCGVLIGFNPGFSFTLILMILITLLLNANISFTVLGMAVGRVVSLAVAALSFHTGFFIIHSMGMEDLFRSLCNAPVSALMKLNVYAMTGSLPYALATGIILGAVLGTAVVNIRKKMLEANQHEIVGKTFGNKVSRFLLWLAFGKSKLSLDEEVINKTSLFRKSGIILVAVVVIIGGAFELFLLDLIVRKSIESSISAATGAEVNIGEADLSLLRGDVSIIALQITDPDKPSHNMVQVDRLVADVNIGQLLSGNYAIDLLAGSVLKRDVPRRAPGKVYERKAKEADAQEEAEGRSLEDYFAQAGKWKQYGEKAYDYLNQWRKNADLAAQGKLPEADKAKALTDARKLGYLAAAADLVADRPAWLIHEIRIEQVDLGRDFPEQILIATEICSHPALNRKPSSITLMPTGRQTPTARIVFRFDDPSAKHAAEVTLKGIALGDAVKTSDSFPLNLQQGMADLDAAGLFSVESLDIPFSLLIHNLKASVEEGQEVMGMDSATATEVFSSLDKLEIVGALGGSLPSPRIRIDYDKLTASLKEALLAAGKKELANRANAEMDKAKQELKAQAGQEINKVLGGEDSQPLDSKAKDAIKKLF